MPRKPKSGLDYWLENCWRCTNFLYIHYLENGIDEGMVSLKCKLTGDYVEPWHVDGCKKFCHGQPEEVTVEDKEVKQDEKGNHKK